MQAYLHIATTHIRSQYFNEAILEVVKAIRKEMPDTVEKLRVLFYCHGRRDPAVQHAHKLPPQPRPMYEKVKPESCINWKEFNQSIDDQMAHGWKAREESNAKMQELLDAMNGTGEWGIEWR